MNTVRHTKTPYIFYAFLAAAFIQAAFSGCGKSTGKPDSGLELSESVPPYTTFREIPGITEKEIADIEALQREHSSFIYGMSSSTEAFVEENGKIGGYSALFCEWLTGLFNIRFQPGIYTSDDTLEKLKTGEIDFVGNFRVTEERKKTYYMTDSISERQYKRIRLAGSRSIDQILPERPLRYGFLEGFSTDDAVELVKASVACDIIWLKNFEEIYRAFESKEIDAFIGANVTEASFDSFGSVIAEDFFPLIFSSVSMATANPSFEPIISVVNRALRSGASGYVNYLCSHGYHDYMKHKLFVRLSDEERAYINSHTVIPVVANFDNYPVCFYNAREKEWQGIFFDLLDELAPLTGLSFKLVNDEHSDWPVVYEKLITGEAAFIAALIRTNEREGKFIWPETAMMPDYYALISRADYRNISINEILNVKVGLAKDTAYAAMFRQWFPNHTGTIEYDSMEEALDALQRGELDMVMATLRRLMLLTHYQERPGYKSNMVFGQPIETIFGFNKNETVLCSIIDKALQLVDTRGISDQWMRKTYDYRVNVAEARLPWLIGTSVLSLSILILVIVFSIKNMRTGKRLEKQVVERTRELMLQTTKLQTMFDSIPDIAFCKDLNLRYTQCNKVMEDYFGLTEESIVGKDDIAALGFSGDIEAPIKEADMTAIRESRKIVIEESIPYPDGGMRLLETVRAPLVQDGNTVGLIAIARDITQRKAMEEEARNASEAKSSFIANMSHEMRSPMNVIVGLTDLMLEEIDPTTVRDNLKKINTAGNTLLGLISDVLDISKIEAGKLELAPVQYDLPSLLNDIIILNIIRIEDKPITFRLDISEELPSSIFGDDLRVRQIANNLLSNAFKYTREGSVTLGVSCERDSGGGEDLWMSFCVKDTGIGIREEDIKRLFSDYNQVDTQANRKVEGTGLGLSITKKLVELMDGQISVESEYGKGTTFRARIRQRYINDKPIGPETAENLRSFHYSDKRKHVSQKLVRPDLSYAKVLVVDDMQTNLDVAAGMLRKYKMQVDCSLSGKDAINRIMLGETVYDAVFMDHMMPEMDGIETTARIRAIGTKYAQNIPIIALTANAIVGNEQMFMDNGFQAFMTKPINIMSLDSIVHRWIRDKSKE